MSEEPVSISPYACSLGTVLDHGPEGDIYRIQRPDGQVIAAPANGMPSPAAVEADLANPPPAPVDEAAAWAQFLAGHITVSGIDLKASITARDAFTGQSTLMREGLELGLLAPTTEVTIWDAHNQPHTLTVAACRALLFAYGVAWKTAFDQFAP